MAAPENKQENPRKDDLDEFSESVIWDDMPSPYRRMVQSTYHSNSCRYIYLGILAFNCMLAIWIIVDSVRKTFPHPVFYVFEFLINIALMSDVLVRMWLNGCYRFWHSISNIFEISLVSACLILTIVTVARILGKINKKHRFGGIGLHG